MFVPERIESCPLCGATGGTVLETVEQVDCLDAIANERKIAISSEVTAESSEAGPIELTGCGQCGLEWFKSSIPGSSSFYRDLSSTDRGYYPARRYEFDFVLKKLKPSDRVLDIGSGSGEFLSQAMPLVHAVAGVDTSDDALMKSRERGLTVHKCEPAELELGRTFTIVTAFQILEHLGDTGPLIETAVRHLKTDGRLFISVPNRRRLGTLAADVALDSPPHHVSRWSADQMSTLAERFDLDLVSISEERIGARELVGNLRILGARKLLFGRGTPTLITHRKRFTRGHTLIAEFAVR